MQLKFAEKIDQYVATRDKANAWLLSLQNVDGSVADPKQGVFYYRLLWTWAVTGETVAAHQLLKWFKRNLFTSDGDLSLKYLSVEDKEHYTYLMSNIAYGANLLQEIDVAHACIRVLKRFQDQQSGGFSNSTRYLTANDWIESWITAQVGLAHLIVGHLETAERVGNFLQLVFDRQPNITKCLYFVFDRSTQQLILKANKPDATYLIDVHRGRQYFFGPGLISGFLVRLYQATGKNQYLQLARAYQNFVQSCSPKQFDGIEVCKTGWGAALLYQVTLDEKYLNWAIRVGDYFINSQSKDGRWVDDRFSPSNMNQDIALTAQNVLWIDSIATAIANA